MIPGSKSFVLCGPGKLSVTRYANGRASGDIVEGVSTPIEIATKKRLKRIPWGV